MSSNKTNFLGLHLWEAEDDFLRTEFNENSERMDGAAAGARYEIIADATVGEEANAVAVDLAEVDLTDYWEVELFVHCPIYTTEASPYRLLLTVNGLTTGYDCNPVGANSVQMTGTDTYWAQVNYAGQFSVKLLTGNAAGIAIVHAMDCYEYSGNFHSNNILGRAPVTWEQVESLELTRSTGTFPVGTRFLLRGVKR